MNWIDIKDRLPEIKDGESEIVLVCLGDSIYFIVKFVEKKYTWGNEIIPYQGFYPFSDALASMITHWAEITPPSIT